MRQMTDARTHHYGARLSEFLKVAAVVFAVLLLAAFALPANAQTDPALTFGASVTSANGSLSTKLTWSTTPAASSCTASGHTSWTGTKAASGSLDLPAIALSGTYTLSLNCTWPGDMKATVTWTAPTTNTDGTPLAKCATADTVGPCLAYFNVYRSTNPRLEGAQVTPVRDPNATTAVFNNLPASTQYFGTEAVNGNGVPSPMSQIASKVLTGTTTKSANVTLTVNPVPNSPGNTAVN